MRSTGRAGGPELRSNYPNPFTSAAGAVLSTSGPAASVFGSGVWAGNAFALQTGGTRIEFKLGGERPQPVTVKVYNSLGREVKTLLDAVRTPGRYTMTWDGTDAAGNALPSGVYVYVLRAERYADSRRMLLLR